MVDELLSAYPHQLSFSEAGLRIMITSHFPPRTRLSMASRMLINEVYSMSWSSDGSHPFPCTSHDLYTRSSSAPLLVGSLVTVQKGWQRGISVCNGLEWWTCWARDPEIDCISHCTFFFSFTIVGPKLDHIRVGQVCILFCFLLNILMAVIGRLSKCLNELGHKRGGKGVALAGWRRNCDIARLEGCVQCISRNRRKASPKGNQGDTSLVLAKT